MLYSTYNGQASCIQQRKPGYLLYYCRPISYIEGQEKYFISHFYLSLNFFIFQITYYFFCSISRSSHNNFCILFFSSFFKHFSFIIIISFFLFAGVPACACWNVSIQHGAIYEAGGYVWMMMDRFHQLVFSMKKEKKRRRSNDRYN